MSQPTKGYATILREMAEDYPFHRNRPKPSKAALIAGAEALESLALPGATPPAAPVEALRTAGGRACTISPWPVEDLAEADLPDRGVFLDAQQSVSSEVAAAAAAFADFAANLKKSGPILLAHFATASSSMLGGFKAHSGEHVAVLGNGEDKEKKA
jgi:hypothetical protein